MKIKICGLKYADNLLNISALDPDFIGFIFYEKSPRYVEEFDSKIIQQISTQVKKVGVFVNASIEYVLNKVNKYQLDFVQLHGNETAVYCNALQEQNISIIKAFSVSENFDFENLSNYQNSCTYFLFDTATKNYGGSGKSFNWQVLKNYQLNIPFFLSGGIGLDNINQALNFKHPQLFAFDLNSKLEEYAGFKNLQSTKNIINKIRNHDTV